MGGGVVVDVDGVVGGDGVVGVVSGGGVGVSVVMGGGLGGGVGNVGVVVGTQQCLK